jgi:probable phosphomutase (TIGR03848 family)
VSEQITRVLLIRHAVNDWIGSGKLPGWTPGIHLNERGRQQGQALAERLADQPIKALYSSPLERAQETAEFLRDRLGLPIETTEGVAEVRCGEWQGQPFEELTKTDLWRQVQNNPSDFRFPGGESMLEVQCRAVVAISMIRAAHPGELVAVVSHADVIKILVAYYMGTPLDLFQRVVVNPASITEIAFAGHGPLILRCNDCSHIPVEEEREETEEKKEEQPQG